MSNSLGRHIIVEFHDCSESALQNPEGVRDALQKAALDAEMTLLEVSSVKTSSGVSGWAVIAESHLTAHTFVKERHCAIDMFFCRKDCRYDEAMGVLAKYFNPQKISIRILDRGEIVRSLQIQEDGHRPVHAVTSFPPS